MDIAMNILLLGKTGQLGSALTKSLQGFGQIRALGRSELDLQNHVALQHVLKTQKPDLIINAAAYTQVDKAESEPDLAYQINARAVEVLALFAQQNDALLVHYSTDYVFDGTKETAYLETDKTNPQNQYGLSKRAGEFAIEQSQCRHLIFRTSWAYSATGSNFIKTILNLAQAKSSLKVVADQFGAPTSVELIASVTLLALEAYQKSKLDEGLYHLTASGSTSWYAFACRVVESALRQGMPLQLSPERIEPINTEEYPLPAKRPKNSRLDSSLLTNKLGIELPRWDAQVDKVIEQIRHRELLHEA
jgi:dTDP-4-dehydrorhamnose reductase